MDAKSNEGPMGNSMELWQPVDLTHTQTVHSKETFPSELDEI